MSNKFDWKKLGEIAEQLEAKKDMTLALPPCPKELDPPTFNPFPSIHCECGEVWTQEMHTVCPKCARWPKTKETVHA